MRVSVNAAVIETVEPKMTPSNMANGRMQRLPAELWRRYFAAERPGALEARGRAI